jgi:hypothetical protein
MSLSRSTIVRHEPGGVTKKGMENYELYEPPGNVNANFVQATAQIAE